MIISTIVVTSFSVVLEKSTAINLNNFIHSNSTGHQLNSFIARVLNIFIDVIFGQVGCTTIKPEIRINDWFENPRKSFDGTPYYRHNLNRFIQENEIYKNKGHFQNLNSRGPEL